jgi:Domain of unknown function (DUF5753)
MIRSRAHGGIVGAETVWSTNQPWWHTYEVDNREYISWEADAHHVQEWAVMRMPDLLHTRDYTRALYGGDRVFRADHVVDGSLDSQGRRRLSDEVSSRQHRQGRLVSNSGHPLTYVVVVDEGVLRKLVGSPDIMRAQLSGLIERANWQDVTLRVLPAEAAAQVETSGGFTLLDFPHELPAMFAQYPGGVVAEDDRRLVQRAQLRFNAVLSAPLPPPDSMDFIDELAQTVYPDRS